VCCKWGSYVVCVCVLGGHRVQSRYCNARVSGGCEQFSHMLRWAEDLMPLQLSFLRGATD